MYKKKLNLLLSKEVCLILAIISFAILPQHIYASFTGDGSQIRFIENKGQWPSNVTYAARINAGNIFLESSGITFDLYHTGDWDEKFGHQFENGQHQPSSTLRKHAYKVKLLNTLAHPKLVPSEIRQGHYNYYIGKDPQKWGVGARAYGNIRYTGVWEGIDMIIKQLGSDLKYEFEVAPGRTASDIQLEYEGADDLRLVDGNLQITTSVNIITEQKPYSYQLIDGDLVPVASEFVLEGNILSFRIMEDYNPSEPLIIDPILTFASYTGSTADNFGFTAAFDSLGSLYGGGIVFASGYPFTTGAYDTTWNGGVDIGITKFTPDGSDLEYSTYIGGNGDEAPSSLIINKNNELVILGLTGSSNYPTTSTAIDTTFNGGNSQTFLSNGLSFPNGTDIIVTILNEDGTALVGSTYLGGSENDGLNNNTALGYNYGDIVRGEVIVNDDNEIFVSSSTQSQDFPTLNPLQPAHGGGQDACIFSMSADASTIMWSTFLGGVTQDAGYGLKLDGNQDLYVVGGTNSLNFPTRPGAINPVFLGGQADGWIAKISGLGNTLIHSTFIGTNEYDQSYFVELDNNGDVYFVGQTDGAYPVTGNVYSNPNSGQFITRINPTLSAIQISTVFGKGDGDPELSPTAFLVDECRNIYFSGWGGNTNTAPDTDMSGLPLTDDAFQDTTDGSDFYFFVLSRDAKSLLYATYFGGLSSAEHVDGGTSRFNKEGIIYQAVCAGCLGRQDFPTTPGAWSETNGSSNCNLGVIKFEFQISAAASVIVLPSAIGCAPHTVQFINSGTPDMTYWWDFGDGATATIENPIHTYNNAGTYLVTLAVTDSFICGATDTNRLFIQVYNEPTANFSYTPSFITPGDDIFFTNLSVDHDIQFWNFGDGNTSPLDNPVHSYSDTGTYLVCLQVASGGICRDTICQTIIVSEIALIDIPNAFSPNGDGINEVFYVRGGGVKEMEFKIFNRWGTLLFESNSIKKGWDGTYNGVPQEMEVYVYTLRVVMLTDEEIFRKGNVTLIR